MAFLLDSNCWMQLVRVREHVAEVRDLLATVPADHLFLTDFALYSIALAMRRHKMLEQFPTFVEQSGVGTSVRLVRLEPPELKRVVDACGAYHLDFDDAYQYVASDIHGLTLVSFDIDFDRTPHGRVTPAEARQRYLEETARQQ